MWIVDAKSLNRRVKSLAERFGLAACGVARAEPIGRAGYVRDWIARGMAGEMTYLEKHAETMLDPGKLLPGARSVIVVADVYHREMPEGELGSAAGESGSADEPARGRVAMYAWGEDYHRVVKEKLFGMADALRAEVDPPFEAKVCVDTAPLIEREFAARAGIGWIGKNTLALSESLGSYFFLGAIVTTLEIAADEAAVDHCGSCTACLDACPTDAFPAPYQMDARRCISYLTIEHRSEIDPPLASKMGDWIFGCDDCQTVCPFNRKAPLTDEPRYDLDRAGASLELDAVRSWEIEDYRAALTRSAMKRAKLPMLKRNAEIASTNAREARVGPTRRRT